MKRAILPAVVLAFALSLSACGGSASRPETTSTPAASADVTDPTGQTATEEASAISEAATIISDDTPTQTEGTSVTGEASSPTGENAPAYDTAAYEAAAQAVRDEFIAVTQQGMDDYDEGAHPELPWYTAILTRYPGSYYDAYYDFDGNGVPELLIAVGSDDYKKPVGVYAFDGESMHYLCKEQPVGERAQLNYIDGLFVVNGSGGASSGILAAYRIAANGWDTEIVDMVEYEYTDAQHVNFTSRYGVLSADEIMSRGLNDYPGVNIDVNWNCFFTH